ncbi:cyclic nucleotide-binding domain protein (macronuclear) [Tetrahymena thermophila SB210]|uniref:Cyclic nucleotide-binding domain protein n=1 Tax=Tetrahymena thermophila (strain SB210) TaxID=312017 RepID=Q24C51_TETTS|nr:cyclic nucleotide-binding domain protein [Tetrahymena thermophila SB210]EAS05387.2 cyclic nucleotide-binding domain protein [Tetrahymena thermophila SB210]|eukprot:XP_001025632.2 cyclic nucleotide-binding domain protein [Tetrahymena thermophila SB210]
MNYYDLIALKVLIYIKIFNFLKDIEEIQLQLYMRVKQFYLVQLFNLILKLFIIAHTIACLWYLLGLVELRYLGVEKTWFDESIGADLIWWKLYLAAFYWTLTLMTTGSNVSSTVLQTFYTSFIMLFISIAFGYILSVIGLILAEMAKQQENQTRDIRTINEYMKQRNISNNLKAKVNQNLLHYYQKNFKQQQIENEQVLCRISGELKDSLLSEYNMKILEKISFLQKNFSEQTMYQISLCLKEEYYFPNQIIQFEKDVQNQSLMIITEGQVEIDLYPNSQIKQQNIIQLLNPGDVFGQFSLFTGQAQQFSTKSTDFTKIMRLDRQDLIEIVKKNDSEYQKYCEIKDKILFQNGYQNVDLKCLVCNSQTHLFQNCTNISLNKKGILIKIKILESDKQKRQKFNRKQSHTSTPLILLKYQTSLSKRLQQQLEFEKQFSGQSQSDSSSSDSSSENQQEDIVSQLQNTIKIQSDTFKIESDLNTQQFIDKLNNLRKNSQFIKFNTQELEEIILQADSKKILKVEREEDKETSCSNIENIIQERENIHSLVIENNNQELQQQGIISKNKKTTFHISNYTDQQKQKIVKKLLGALEPSQKYSRQVSSEKRKHVIHDIWGNIIEKNEQPHHTNIFARTNNQEVIQQAQEFNDWIFDCQKDYEFYFSYSNFKQVLTKFQKFQLRKAKQQRRQIKECIKEKPKNNIK